MVNNEKYRKDVNTDTHVRFSEEEFTEIENEAARTGYTAPQLLRNAYFSKDRSVALFNHEEARVLHADLSRMLFELRRIGETIEKSLFKKRASLGELNVRLLEMLDSVSRRIEKAGVVPSADAT